MLMPEGFGEIDRLQHLNGFHVRKGSEIDVLNGLLKQLRGNLAVNFWEVKEGLNLELPAGLPLQCLTIIDYPGQRIRGWGNNNCSSKLQRLEVKHCKNVKHLPQLSCLPILKILKLLSFEGLEFIEEEEEEGEANVASNKLFFPCLEELTLFKMPKLKGWQRGKVAAEDPSSSTSKASAFLGFSSLLKLQVMNCPKLILQGTIPPCPSLREFELHYYVTEELKWLKSLHLAILAFPHVQNIMIQSWDANLNNKGTHDSSLQVDRLALGFVDVNSLLVEQLVLSFSLSSLQLITTKKCKGRLSLPGTELTSLLECHIEDTDGLEILHIPSPHFQEAILWNCKGLTSIELESPISIRISNCPELKNLQIAHTDAIKTFEISSYQKDPVAGADWDSIPNLNECSSITMFKLRDMDGVFIERLLSSPSLSLPSSTTLQYISIFNSTGSLTIPFPCLEEFIIWGVPSLKVLNIKSQHLSSLTIWRCYQLTNVHIANPTSLTTLELIDCPELGLITGVDWDALTNLTHLIFSARYLLQRSFPNASYNVKLLVI